MLNYIVSKSGNNQLFIINKEKIELPHKSKSISVLDDILFFQDGENKMLFWGTGISRDLPKNI